LGVKDESLMINLAHTQFLNNNVEKARKSYNMLIKSQNPETQSIALTQLGLIYFLQGNPEKSLYNFKKALIQNNFNEVARYNYELTKKYLAANPTPPLPQKKDPGQNPQERSRTDNKSSSSSASPTKTGNTGTTNDLQNSGNNPSKNISPGNEPGNQGNAGDVNRGTQQPNSGTKNKIKAGEAGNNTKGLAPEAGTNQNANIDKKAGTDNISGADEELQTLKARLRKTNLTPEKAKMLLEAMRQAELQYLQQVPQKPTRKTKKTFPDW